MRPLAGWLSSKRHHFPTLTLSFVSILVDEYILMAKEKHGYNVEQVRKRTFNTLYHASRRSSHPAASRPQALGMLLWHKHDVERSLADLANFTPFPEEWSTEDKVMFEQAFGFHGKSFHRIQQMVRQRQAQDALLSFSFFLKSSQIRYLPLKTV